MQKSLLANIAGKEGLYLSEFLLVQKDCELHGIIYLDPTFNIEKIDFLDLVLD